MRDVWCLDISSCGLLFAAGGVPSRAAQGRFLLQSSYPKAEKTCTVITVVCLCDMYINYSLPPALIFRPLSITFACLLSVLLCILPPTVSTSSRVRFLFQMSGPWLNGLSSCWIFFAGLFFFKRFSYLFYAFALLSLPPPSSVTPPV